MARLSPIRSVIRLPISLVKKSALGIKTPHISNPTGWNKKRSSTQRYLVRFFSSAKEEAAPADKLLR